LRKAENPIKESGIGQRFFWSDLGFNQRGVDVRAVSYWRERSYFISYLRIWLAFIIYWVNYLRDTRNYIYYQASQYNKQLPT